MKVAQHYCFCGTVYYALQSSFFLYSPWMKFLSVITNLILSSALLQHCLLNCCVRRFLSFQSLDEILIYENKLKGILSRGRMCQHMHQCMHQFFKSNP